MFFKIKAALDDFNKNALEKYSKSELSILAISFFTSFIWNHFDANMDYQFPFNWIWYLFGLIGGTIIVFGAFNIIRCLIENERQITVFYLIKVLAGSCFAIWIFMIFVGW